MSEISSVEIPDGRVFDFKDKNARHASDSKYIIFNSVTDLGLTVGSATIADAYTAMPNYSILITQSGDLSSGEKPSGFYGTILMVKSVNAFRGYIEAKGDTVARGDYRMGVDTSTGVPTGVWESDKLKAYSIGEIYMSTKSTSPASLFGGAWERITGRFLLAATDGGSSGASQAAGRTGGESTHTLTTNEMAPHTHGSKTLTGYTRFRRYGTSGSGADIAGIIGSSGIVSKTSETWSGTHGLVGAGGTNVSGPTADRITVNATHEHDSVGGGQAHNNMPPYLAVYMWERIA